MITEHQKLTGYNAPSAPASPNPGSNGNAPASPQEFLFIDSSNTKNAGKSYKGNRSVRSHVMQRARKERPWSTSRQQARHEKWQLASRPRVETQPATRTASDGGRVKPEERSPKNATIDELYIGGARHYESHMGLCRICQDFDCSPGQSLCGSCQNQAVSLPQRDSLANRPFDPFNTLPVALNEDTSSLWEYCEYSRLHVFKRAALSMKQSLTISVHEE